MAGFVDHLHCPHSAVTVCDITSTSAAETRVGSIFSYTLATAPAKTASPSSSASAPGAVPPACSVA
eukprot:CAMPEP_0119167422 /NCGR_PEP_ID=MMETSP1315-20130426/6557_1 /TAXON_ID=676789 /ORGANISM="Prasinoderma singularis, Strain RCC927" /LENGTH=65 /DNA_ID=CAMNT_0007160873 /DNA_START=128 /DNA_END=321 /DNA_ORIENTATION=+